MMWFLLCSTSADTVFNLNKPTEVLHVIGIFCSVLWELRENALYMTSELLLWNFNLETLYIFLVNGYFCVHVNKYYIWISCEKNFHFEPG